MFREKLKRNIHGISDQAMDALARYRWPGNVRELRHIIERACVLCDGPTISLEHFPEEIQKPTVFISEHPDKSDQRKSVTTLPPYISEEDEIIEVLKHARGNKSKAARMLNIDRSTLYRKMQRIGIASDVVKTGNK